MSRSPNAQRVVPCMPPLLEEETKNADAGDTSFNGTACENIVKSYFLTQRINIAEPHVDDGVDLLIEKPGEGWKRGQVKKVVYQYKLDWGMREKKGVEVYRSRYNFNFQNSGKSKQRKQRGPEDYDYFYHVLLTPYRQLIWETPSNVIPLRKDGTFIMGKNVCLDRNNWIRKKAEIDYRKLLMYSRYDPIIFQTYPDFFLKPKQQSLHEFFDY